MQIADHKHVTCDFTLTGGDGTLITRSTDDDQLNYVHGRQEIPPEFEAALEGKSAGDSIAETLSPEDAFGQRDESLVHEVPRDRFPPGVDIQLGMIVGARGPQGEVSMRVVRVTDQIVTLDENRPLAGVTLHFEVTVREVRDATAGELPQG